MFFLSACENEVEKVNFLAKDENLPVEIAHNIVLTYSDSGKVKMKLSAPLLERFVKEKEYTEFREGVHVEFYNTAGEKDSELTANYAIDYTKQEKMEAKGNVIVINQNGDKLNTEHLIWNQKLKQITSEVFVQITTEDEIIYGDGLVANEDFTQYEIVNTKGIINIEENEDE